MKDYIIRAVDKDKSIRIFIGKTTNMVQEIRDRHGSSATASAALGRLATMASIMGLDLKSKNDSLTLRFDGNGVGGKLTAISDSSGNVRVTAQNPKADAPSKYQGKLDVSAFVGVSGSMAIIKDLGLKEPYTGLSNIVSGEIAEDFANYFFYSEQTPSIVSLGVLVDKDLSIRAAGGIFVQVMPGALDETITKLEAMVKELRPVSDLIDEGLSPEQILDLYFSDFEPEILAKEEVFYKCHCSRERMARGLISIGKKDLLEIAKEDGHAHIICDFCGNEYEFSEEELLELAAQAGRD
ncbi:Hsp33 family molecular chaperone HslO [Peptoniphilaceae bacterium SGI.131]